MNKIVTPTLGQRARVSLPFFAIAAITVLAAVVVGLFVLKTDQDPSSPDNPRANGTMAVRRVLEDNGVNFTVAANVRAALAAAKPGSTLVVVNPAALDIPTRKALETTQADLVLLDADTAGATWFEKETGGTYGLTTFGTYKKLPAKCSAPAAQAAGTISEATIGLYVPPDKVTACFPIPENESFAYLTFPANGRTIHLVSDAKLFQNSEITKDGNAALALWLLGAHKDLTWYHAQLGDTVAKLPQNEPPGLWPLIGLGVVVTAFGALVHGRRFGRLVPEKLPVAVPAAETARGLGRLYARSGDRTHAAAQLRAATALRCAQTLGVPPGSPPDTLVESFAAATRYSQTQLKALFYGPTPKTGSQLVALAQALAEFESEVHHR